MAELRIAPLWAAAGLERDGAPDRGRHPQRPYRPAATRPCTESGTAATPVVLLWADVRHRARPGAAADLFDLNKAVGLGGGRRPDPPSGSPGRALLGRLSSGLLAGRRDHGHEPEDACPARVAPLAAAFDDGDLFCGFSLRDSTELRRLESSRPNGCGASSRGPSSAWPRPRSASTTGTSGRPARRGGPRPARHEPAHRQLMPDLHLERPPRGRPAPVPGLPAVLEEELGVEPLEETVAVHEAIQASRLPHPRGDPRPGGGCGHPAPSSPTRLPSRFGGRDPRGGGLAAAHTLVPLVGRDEERGGLVDPLRAGGHRRAAGGDRGRGRDRQDPAGRRALRPRPVAWGVGGPGRGDEEEAGVAYGPFIEGLRKSWPPARRWTRCRRHRRPRPAGCCPSWSRPTRGCPSRGRWAARRPGDSSRVSRSWWLLCGARAGCCFNTSSSASRCLPRFLSCAPHTDRGRPCLLVSAVRWSSSLPCGGAGWPPRPDGPAGRQVLLESCPCWDAAAVAAAGPRGAGPGARAGRLGLLHEAN